MVGSRVSKIIPTRKRMVISCNSSNGGLRPWLAYLSLSRQSMVHLYLSRLAAVLFALALSQSAVAQCTFTPTGIVTNLSCFGANDGAINLTIQSGGGGTGATGYCLPSYTQTACGCPSTWDYIENVSTTGG